MKATGIVRRIDDLGRVVIPKEIRRTMRIREGDPLEIYTDRDGEVIFKKYSPIGELGIFAGQYADTLSKTCGINAVICDRDAVIACAGLPKKEFMERKLSEGLDRIMEQRGFYECDSEKISVTPDGAGHYISCAMPIQNSGDIVGCVISVKNDNEQGRTIGKDVEHKLIQTAAGFLGRQLEE